MTVVNKLQKSLEVLGSYILTIGVSPAYIPLSCLWYLQDMPEEGKVYSSIMGLHEFVEKGGKKLSQILYKDKISI